MNGLEISRAYFDECGMPMLEEKFPDDHVPGEDAFVGIKMHTHLFRYFSGRPGAAALRARLNAVRTLAEIREIIKTI